MNGLMLLSVRIIRTPGAAVNSITVTSLTLFYIMLKQILKWVFFFIPIQLNICEVLLLLDINYNSLPLDQ